MSEPTTGEIVQALRNCFERSNVNGICMKCEFTGTKGKYSIDADECGYGCETNLVKYAITRLESQEQAIAALTARAEKAERERDAAATDMIRIIAGNDPCSVCGKNGLIECMMGCAFEWRGLPQEGDKDE